MAKKIAGQLKLQVPAGSATPSPPIGPALGQRGINIMEFCKAFNAQTQEMEKGSPIPVVITYYQDKSFTFVIKTPPVTYFLKKDANLKSGSKEPGKAKAGTVSRDKVREIAEAKMKDLNANDVDAAMRMVEGSARTMDLEVVGYDHGKDRKACRQVPRGHRSGQGLCHGRGAESAHGPPDGEVRRDDRSGDEPQRRPASCRPDGS